MSYDARYVYDARRAISGGKFTFGKYKDRYVADIADEDPGYLEWFMDNVKGISKSDMTILKEAWLSVEDDR